MFSSSSRLRKRTPENGIDRENFLSLLVDEYLNSDSFEARCQVLSNLANFAYDPINYIFIRETGVLDIFLYVLKNETNVTLLRFTTAGICNLCIDPLNAEYILQNLGLDPIISQLKSENNEIVADTITTLIYLHCDATKAAITAPVVKQDLSRLKMSQEKRISNLATVFLQNICQ